MHNIYIYVFNYIYKYIYIYIYDSPGVDAEYPIHEAFASLWDAPQN